MSADPMLLGRISAVVDRHPDRAALVVGDDVLTYADVERESAIVARGLVGAGLGRGSRVAVLSPNHLSVLVATLGIIRSGAAWIPLNSRDSVESLAELCRRFAVDMLIHHPDLEPALDRVRSVSPRTTVGVALGAQGHDDLFAWAAARDRAVALTAPDPGQLAAVFATGGTTGVPRGVCYSYRVLSAIAGNYVELLDHPHPVFLAAGPLTHVSGRVSLGVMAAGGTTVVLPHFDPGAVWAIIEQHRITTMMLPTTLLTRLLAHPAAGSTDTSSLKRVSVGASPVPVGLIKRAINVFGPVVAQNYGQTEAPIYIATMQPFEYLSAGGLAPDERLASCGRPTRFSEVRTVGTDGNEVAAGETGEIVVKGNFVMDGYLDDDAATAEARLGDWHRTGDLGTFDDDGYLRIVGRMKDLIISGGFNVYPAEIENVLAEQPCVHESAVIGLPDPDWGERVVAVVEATDGEPCDVEQLAAHVRARLGSVKTPKEIVTVASLPRNANGKILKHVLVAELGSRSRPPAD